MLSQIVSTLFLFAISSATPITETITRDLSEIYRLPGATYPTSYEVRLFVDPNNEAYFYGNTSIRILALVPTDEIVLHAYAMEIESIAVYAVFYPDTNLFASFSLASDDTHFLRITTTSALSAAVPYIIDINYVGSYAADMFGTYVSSYTAQDGTRKSLVTTQMQPTFARRSFPCYDEPALKALFRLTIYAPAEFTTVVSNTEEVNRNTWPDVAGYVRHEFEQTVVMSTYLIAYLVSEFDHISNDDNMLFRTPFKVYSRPGTQEFAVFGLDFGQRNLAALEEYTEMPYALSKMDKAAIPDFAAGAMENWGLVTYREAALLVQDGVTTTTTKQNIGRIICHENMHQWFGNEVSPLWWNYLWLNEGFANFFESFATDFVLPEWRMMDQFVLALQNVMQNDAVMGVNPMTAEVYTPSEVLGNFNSVAYQKSGSVIRMMQNFLTSEVFRKGLVYFLRNNQKSAATPSELFLAMEQAMIEVNYTLPVSISIIMNSWVNEGGFPLLTVNRQAAGANSISIRQERYFTVRTQTSNVLWYVPLNWALSTNPDFNDTAAAGWLTPSVIAQNVNIPGLNASDWYIVNKQQAGYYRVNYDVNNWQALVNVLNSDSFEQIHYLNRAQLIDDAFNLARNERLDYDIVFNLASYLKREKDYIPWGAANRGLNYLNTVFRGSENYPLFQRFVLELTESVYQELGFTPSANEEHVASFLRTIVLNYNCQFGNQDCTDTAQTLLREYIANPSATIHPDLQNIVYCSGLRNGDPDDFDFLWNRYLTTTDSSEETLLLNSLPCTSNREKLDMLLNQVISPDSQVREQDRHTVLVATINSGPENMEVAFDFLIEHFKDVQTSVQGLTGTTNILAALSGALSTEQHGDKLSEFMAKYENDFSAGEVAATNAAYENYQATRTWVSSNMEAVTSWLRANVSGAPSSAVSSIFVITLGYFVLNLIN